ncbi:zinc finger MYM-type protein 1-like [Hydra vulgaris]|uniref:zinc finger MYM-type protein 1-like n=1 Tax=Hydra vulgaris TaxID=6087 RepID=UPI0032EA2865
MLPNLEKLMKTQLFLKKTSNIFINKDHFVPLISLKCIPKKYQAPKIFAPKVVKLPEINQLTSSKSSILFPDSTQETDILDSVKILSTFKKIKQLTIDQFAIKSPFPTDKKICVISSPIKLKSSTTLSIAECSSKYIHSPIKANLNSKSSSSAFGNKCELSFVNKYDIGLYETYGTNKLGNEDKFDLLKNVYKPSSSFHFESNKSGRSFQFSWLSLYSWLAYSEIKKDAYCVNCVIFGSEESSHNASKLVQLYKSPFVAYSNAINKFNKHAESSPIHQTATLKATHFRQCMEQKINFIDLNLKKVIDEQVKKNREILKSIVLAIIMCGKQNIPLRGHRDDSFYYENENSNSGNLQSILKLISDCAENSLVNGRISTPKNATYRSKTTQNELVNICNDIINSKLKCEVKKAKFFSILADEASDVSNMEQMPLVLRFVNDNCEICELLFGFIPCDSGLSGEAIGSQILNSIKDLGLEMKFCVGQGYDGAGNMAGNCSGAAVRIKAIYPKALYVHCGSHVLNLCVANACNIQIVSNMMSNVRVISQFFNFSPKRFDVLKKKILRNVSKSSSLSFNRCMSYKMDCQN